MLTSTVTYLYGHDCLGESRDDEWLYYLNDGVGYVRQGADESGQVVSSWLFNPDGTGLEGPNGPVSHLICGGVYDWSTGLVHRNGRYFDPMLGIWLALAPLVVVQSWRGRRRKRRGMPWYVLVLVVVSVGGIATACGDDSDISGDQECIDKTPPGSGPPGPPPEQSFEGYHIILACGLRTNCPDEEPMPEYNSQVPLQPIRDLFVERGGDYTYLGNQDALSDIPGSTGRYADQIVTEMNSRMDSKGIFLVGHSRGATAAVWAASISGHPKLKGIAILDSYLLDDGYERCLSGEYRGCVADGVRVKNTVQMFMGRSGKGGDDIQFPVDTKEVTLYPSKSHEEIAVNTTVAKLIIDFFVDIIAEGDK